MHYFFYAQLLNCVQLFVTPWTVACQAHLSMGLSRQNTGVGFHFLLHYSSINIVKSVQNIQRIQHYKKTKVLTLISAQSGL